MAVKISFLWCRKHCVYAAVSFAASVTSWYLRHVMQNCTSVILYMNIICNAQWLFDAYLEILDCSADFTRRQKLFKQESIFKQTRVDFLPWKYDVISQLRHSYAKGPFCVTRLIWLTYLFMFWNWLCNPTIPSSAFTFFDFFFWHKQCNLFAVLIDIIISNLNSKFIQGLLTHQ